MKKREVKIRLPENVYRALERVAAALTDGNVSAAAAQVISLGMPEALKQVGAVERLVGGPWMVPEQGPNRDQVGADVVPTWSLRRDRSGTVSGREQSSNGPAVVPEQGPFGDRLEAAAVPGQSLNGPQMVPPEGPNRDQIGTTRTSPFSLSNKEKDKGDYEVIPDEVVKEKGKATTVGNKRGGGDSDGGRGERGGAGEREGKGVRALGELKEAPAVQAYRKVMGLWPTREEAELMAEQVEAAEQLEVWRRVLEVWLERGWNPRNVQGMLERYRDELARGARLVEVSYQEALRLWDKMGNVGKFPGWFIEQARKYGEVEGIEMPDGKIGWRLPARFVAKVKSGNWDYFRDVLHVNGA